MSRVGHCLNLGQDGLSAEYSRGKLAYEIFIAAFAVMVMGINVLEMLIPDSLTDSAFHTVRHSHSTV